MLSNEQEPLYIPDDTTTLQILRRMGFYALDVDFEEFENDQPGSKFRVVQRISEAWQEFACRLNWLEKQENVLKIGIERVNTKVCCSFIHASLIFSLIDSTMS